MVSFALIRFSPGFKSWRKFWADSSAGNVDTYQSKWSIWFSRYVYFPYFSLLIGLSAVWLWQYEEVSSRLEDWFSKYDIFNSCDEEHRIDLERCLRFESCMLSAQELKEYERLHQECAAKNIAE